MSLNLEIFYRYSMEIIITWWNNGIVRLCRFINSAFASQNLVCMENIIVEKKKMKRIVKTWKSNRTVS